MKTNLYIQKLNTLKNVLGFWEKRVATVKRNLETVKIPSMIMVYEMQYENHLQYLQIAKDDVATFIIQDIARRKN